MSCQYRGLKISRHGTALAGGLIDEDISKAAFARDLFRAQVLHCETNDDAGITELQNNRAKSIDSQFGAYNFSYAPSEAFEFSGFAIYSRAENILEEKNILLGINLIGFLIMKIKLISKIQNITGVSVIFI